MDIEGSRGCCVKGDSGTPTIVCETVFGNAKVSCYGFRELLEGISGSDSKIVFDGHY